MSLAPSLCRARFALSAALVLASLAAGGAASAQSAHRGALDARVPMLFAARAARGTTLPVFAPSRAFEQSGRAPLLVHFRRDPSPEELARWEELGADVGRKLASGAVKVTATEEALAAMEHDGVLLRVSVDLAPRFVHQPLDLARSETGVTAGVATYRKQTKKYLGGAGILVGDIDTSCDIYHPAFFKPGPPVAWVDVDGDGALTVGVDGVDLDHDGTIQPPEVLRQLDGRATMLFGGSNDQYGTGDAAFNPGWDYLWLDTNGDGRRNVGPEVEGAEALAGLGEPTFAADDVDGDGKLRLPERLVPLAEPKFRAIQHFGKVYERGKNLATYKPVSAGDDAGHATAMLGAVAGGQPGISRWLGFAPDAEIVLATSSDFLASLTDKLQWLVDQGADVVNTEFGDFGTSPSDGSTEFEQLVDAVVAQGVVVTSPAGNLGYSKKHAFATIPAVSAATSYDNGIALEDPAGEVSMSITWREGNVAVGGSITTTDGDVIDLSVDESNGLTAKGRHFSVVHGTTPKNAGYLLVVIQGALPATGTAIALKTTSAESATASLYMSDDVSSWSGGANFVEGDVEGCMNSPAFAEGAIAISAYALHVGAGFSPYPDKAGALRGFSGRGPDLWGGPGIDLAGPDNGVSASPDHYTSGGKVADGVVVHWAESGGTSGAGASVAGAVALMKQATGLEGTKLRDAVVAAARTDAQTKAGTEAMWGKGKLGIGIEPAPGAAPTATLGAPAKAAVGAPVELEAQVADDGDLASVQARWDFGYDGTWDVDWQPGTKASTAMTAGSLDVKVEVMDADGWIAAATGRILEGEPEPQGTGGGGAGGGGTKAAASDDGGCGCRTSTSDAPAGTTVLASLALLASLRRRRRPA